jgi:hypothetical protein
VSTGRPRKASSRSMRVACSGMIWAGAEATWAGLLGQLGADEGQRLFGQFIRQLGGSPGGLGEVPAVGEEVVETDLRSFAADGRAEWAVMRPFEDSRLDERRPRARLPSGGQR